MSLHYLTTSELIGYFRQCELKPSELVLAYESQYKEVNQKTNAFSFTFFEQAYDQAKIADKAYQQGNYKALTGISIAVKDETFVEGQPMTNGSVLLKDNIATSTDPVPERLLSEQAIIIGRTTTPEFSTSSVTWSDLWGVSSSPWNTNITCGGSSGGSAIAVASGMCAFANGTDIGGSVRIPAAMCGVLGYKPPHGRVPEIAPYNLDPYCHHGLLTRNVSDLRLAYEKIKGPHWQDSHSFVPEVPADILKTKAVSELKIAISYNLGFYEVEEEIAASMVSTAKQLQEAGAIIEEVELAWDEQVIQTAKIHQRMLMGQLLYKHYSAPEKYSQLTSYVKDYIDNVRDLEARDIIEANMYMCKMWDALAGVFNHFDVLICPTVATTKVNSNFDYSTDKIKINGKIVDSNKGWFMTYPFNTFGQCPVLAIPNGHKAENGIPTSIQIVGRPYEEQHVMRVAEFIEQSRPLAFYENEFPDFTARS